MPDKPLSGLPPNMTERRIEAVGARILGNIDPRTMTYETFEQSPDLLFHGSAKPINFSADLDYQSPEYLAENDGSMTLGFGFYTTDDKDEALNYSVVRQGRGKVHSQIIATPILPYQARVLDLRNKNDLHKNTPVPREFSVKWREKFLKYLEAKPPRDGNIEIFFSAVEGDYLKLLDEAIGLEEIDLRVLLGTWPSPKLKNSMDLPAPPWTLLFPEFMKEEGYDGIVYNEGGEGKEAKGGASYVFYNLSKIGTYESWHK